MKNQIALNNVSHYFETPHGRISLFDDLSLNISGQSSLAITGPSGVGKSSLLSLAAGLEPPRDGEISFTCEGQQISIVELRQKSGFIFQQFHLLEELDALGNIALPLRLKGNRKANEIARNWLDKIGLSDRANHKPNQLSGGEQQRVAIARAFVTDPVFIFADEPTGNLDAQTSTGVSDLMFDFAKQTGSALVIVTHSEELAQRAEKCFALSDTGLEQIK
ncbi:ATP-binding cassette domain-containing protein [Sphingorhabdus sp. Alg231-15]|uniref:ATP-binding cassette domain-containing protein n=1 Tax=Sphingorhabdus sp. Alg231-15 TaxID=1922222 RepID=UPI000D54E6E2